MSGLRILVLTSAAFALICLGGFLALESGPAHDQTAASAPEVASRTPAARRAERDEVAVAVVTAAVEDEARASARVLPVAAAAPVPQAPQDERAPTWTGRVITAPGSRWIRETEREARRLLSLCMETDGHQVEGPVEIAIHLTYSPDGARGPSERRAELSVQDPYLQACASDSLLDLAYPDPGGPADFLHSATFAWDGER